MADFNTLAFQNHEFKILGNFKISEFQHRGFKVLADFKIFVYCKILAFKNPELKTWLILALQNPQFKALANFNISAYNFRNSGFFDI